MTSLSGGQRPSMNFKYNKYYEKLKETAIVQTRSELEYSDEGRAIIFVLFKNTIYKSHSQKIRLKKTSNLT